VPQAIKKDRTMRRAVLLTIAMHNLGHCLAARGQLRHSQQQVPQEMLTVVTAACGSENYASAAVALKTSLERFSTGPLQLSVIYDTDVALNRLKRRIPKTNTGLQVKFVAYDRGGKAVAAYAPRLEEPDRFQCANAKLILSSLLPDVQGLVLWVDADTRIRRDITQVVPWFREQQKGKPVLQAAMSWESAPTYARNWYKCCSSIPGRFYRPFGLNSGVIVLDFKLWRGTVAKKSYLDLLQDGTIGMSMVDQDVFNIFFQQHRDHLVQLPFEYNWRGATVCGVAEARIEHFNGCGVTAALEDSSGCH